MSSQITFGRVNADEARIYQDGDHVGDLYRQRDILDAGVALLHDPPGEDPRGPESAPTFAHPRDRHPRLVDTHPALAVMARGFGSWIAAVKRRAAVTGNIGRAATRPGCPAEPAARSRPSGRVSLSPSLACARCALRLQAASRRSSPSGATPTTTLSPAMHMAWPPIVRAHHRSGPNGCSANRNRRPCVGRGNVYPVMLAHCDTRAHCTNPAGPSVAPLPAAWPRKL